MSGNVGTINTSLTLNTGKFQSEVANSKKAIRRFKQEAYKNNRTVEQSFNKLRLSVVALGAAILLTGTRVARGISRMTSEGDRIGKLTQRLQVAVSDFTELSIVANLAGANSEQLATGLQRLDSAFSALNIDNTLRSLRQFGIDPNRLVNTTGIERLRELSTIIAQLESQADRVNLVERLLGRGGVELLPLLLQGGGSISAQQNAVSSLAINTREGFTNLSQSLTDRLTMINNGIRAIYRDAFEKLGPKLLTSLEKIEVAILALLQMDLFNVRGTEKSTDIVDSGIEKIKRLFSVSLVAIFTLISGRLLSAAKAIIIPINKMLSGVTAMLLKPSAMLDKSITSFTAKMIERVISFDLDELLENTKVISSTKKLISETIRLKGIWAALIVAIKLGMLTLFKIIAQSFSFVLGFVLSIFSKLLVLGAAIFRIFILIPTLIAGIGNAISSLAQFIMEIPLLFALMWHGIKKAFAGGVNLAIAAVEKLFTEIANIWQDLVFEFRNAIWMLRDSFSWIPGAKAQNSPKPVRQPPIQVKLWDRMEVPEMKLPEMKLPDKWDNRFLRAADDLGKTIEGIGILTGGIDLGAGARSVGLTLSGNRDDAPKEFDAYWDSIKNAGQILPTIRAIQDFFPWVDSIGESFKDATEHVQSELETLRLNATAMGSGFSAGGIDADPSVTPNIQRGAFRNYAAPEIKLDQIKQHNTLAENALRGYKDMQSELVAIDGAWGRVTDRLDLQTGQITTIVDKYYDFNEALTTMGKGLADGLAEAIVQGRKLGDILRSLISTFAQSFLSGAFQAMGASFFGGMFGGGKALGGQVIGGNAYMIGEHGPEMFIPSTNGYIVPNNEMGGNITQVINISPGVKEEIHREILAALPIISNFVQGDQGQRLGRRPQLKTQFSY